MSRAGPLRALRAVGRLALVVLHVFVGLGIIVLRFPGLSQPERDVRVQRWAARLLQHFGIALVVHGQPPAGGPVLLVANHISWLDIVVMHAARHCRFVSKASVRHWPVVGTLATAAGTLYIERESRRDAMRVVHHMAERLQAGDVLAVFPEGTTGDGRTMLPFHANLFQAAVAAQSPVLPIGLRFIDGKSGETSFAPSFVGDETLLGSLWRTACAEHLQAVVHYGLAHGVDGRDRRALAQALQGEVERLRSTP